MLSRQVKISSEIPSERESPIFRRIKFFEKVQSTFFSKTYFCKRRELHWDFLPLTLSFEGRKCLFLAVAFFKNSGNVQKEFRSLQFFYEIAKIKHLDKKNKFLQRRPESFLAFSNRLFEISRNFRKNAQTVQLDMWRGLYEETGKIFRSEKIQKKFHVFDKFQQLTSLRVQKKLKVLGHLTEEIVRIVPLDTMESFITSATNFHSLQLWVFGKLTWSNIFHSKCSSVHKKNSFDKTSCLWEEILIKNWKFQSFLRSKSLSVHIEISFENNSSFLQVMFWTRRELIRKLRCSSFCWAFVHIHYGKAFSEQPKTTWHEQCSREHKFLTFHTIFGHFGALDK